MKKTLIAGLLALSTAAGTLALPTTSEAKQVWELSGRPLTVILSDNPLVNAARERHKDDTVWYFPDCGQVSFIKGEKSEEDLKIDPNYANIFELWMEQWWTNPDSMAAGSCSSGVCIYNIFPNVDCAEVNIAQANTAVSIFKGTVYLGTGQENLERKMKAMENTPAKQETKPLSETHFTDQKSLGILDRAKGWMKNVFPNRQESIQPTSSSDVRTEQSTQQYIPRVADNGHKDADSHPDRSHLANSRLELLLSIPTLNWYPVALLNDHLLFCDRFTQPRYDGNEIQVFNLQGKQVASSMKSGETMYMVDNGRYVFFNNMWRMYALNSETGTVEHIRKYTGPLGHMLASILSFGANSTNVFVSRYKGIEVLDMNLSLLRTIEDPNLTTFVPLIADDNEVALIHYPQRITPDEKYIYRQPTNIPPVLEIYSLPSFTSVFIDDSLSQTGDMVNAPADDNPYYYDLFGSDTYLLVQAHRRLKLYDRKTHQLLWNRTLDETSRATSLSDEYLFLAFASNSKLYKTATFEELENLPPLPHTPRSSMISISEDRIVLPYPEQTISIYRIGAK